MDNNSFHRSLNLKFRVKIELGRLGLVCPEIHTEKAKHCLGGYFVVNVFPHYSHISPHIYHMFPQIPTYLPHYFHIFRHIYHIFFDCSLGSSQ